MPPASEADVVTTTPPLSVYISYGILSYCNIGIRLNNVNSLTLKCRPHYILCSELLKVVS